ncbi:MAG TPA: ATP-binding protein [Streptosporangiaceae bacterium]
MTAHRASTGTGTEARRARRDCLLTGNVPPQTKAYRQPPWPPSKYSTAGQFAASRELTAQPEAVGTARDFTRYTLGGWGLQELIDDAVLVVSELVTNALQHASSGGSGAAVIKLRLLGQPPCLMCMVTDPSRDIPLRRQAGPADGSGRGLQVIESCCSRWGWHLLDEGGKVVWALLPHG